LPDNELDSQWHRHSLIDTQCRGFRIEDEHRAARTARIIAFEVHPDGVRRTATGEVNKRTTREDLGQDAVADRVSRIRFPEWKAHRFDVVGQTAE
jgi:hypothetical protein